MLWMEGCRKRFSFSVFRPTIIEKRLRFFIEHRTSNIEHRTSNIEHRPTTINHRTNENRITYGIQFRGLENSASIDIGRI